jgi:Beta/Gamma crystallin
MDLPQFSSRWLLACAVGFALPALAQDIELYDQPRFGGMRLTLTTEAADLAAYSFGGRIQSVVVRNGSWEFCTQQQFRGACITVGPGRYAELPPALRGTLMSVRSTAWTGGNAPPPPPPLPPFSGPGPYPGQPGQPQHPGRFPPPFAGSAEPVVLFENANFSGQRLALSAASTRLNQQAFNDLATAVEISRGRWQFCEHADFGGECQVLGPGRHLFSGRLYQGVSSLRPVGGADNRPLAVYGGITLFEHGDHQGREQFIGEPVPNLSQMNFNDRVSSVEVMGGRWELCTDADYGGRCIVLGPGRYNIDKALNDRISSVRPR